MEIERARELVAAVNRTTFAAMGVVPDAPEDPGATLAELLEAKRLVEEHGEHVVKPDGRGGGS